MLCIRMDVRANRCSSEDELGKVSQQKQLPQSPPPQNRNAGAPIAHGRLGVGQKIADRAGVSLDSGAAHRGGGVLESVENASMTRKNNGERPTPYLVHTARWTKYRVPFVLRSGPLLPTRYYMRK